MKKLIFSCALLLSASATFSQPNRSMPGEPMVRLARITVDPERLNEYNDLLREEIEASLSLEPGVLSLYAVSEKENPANITIVEIYESHEAYRSHILTPHFLKYKEGTAEMVLTLELVEVNPLLPGIVLNVRVTDSDATTLREQSHSAVCRCCADVRKDP